MPRKVMVQCPKCKNQYSVVVYNVVDARRNPELKELLIRGRLNVAVCPYCGTGGMLNAPLLYFDPDKELALVYLPPNVGKSDLERQQIIGDLTNQILGTLPPEERKAYILQPKEFITYKSFIEEILKAEGLTFEEVMAQEVRISLLEALLTAPEQEWDKILQESEILLDSLFVQILAGFLQEMQARGQKELVEKLNRLQQKVSEFLKAREDELRQGLLDAMLEASDEELEALVAHYRPFIDYRFYLNITERIDRAKETEKAEEADKLAALRDKILDITARQDAEAREALEKASALLREVWDSEDRLKALRERADDVDMTFLAVLSANLDLARSRNDAEATKELEALADAAVEIMREKAPPEIKLINELMDASYPEETKKLLEDNSSLVNEDLVKMMDALAQDLSQQGYSEAAHHLLHVREQAAAMVS